MIVKSLYPVGHEVYALKEGQLFSTSVTDATLQWTEEEIPKLTQVFGVNTKTTIGRTLFWSGSVLAVGSGLYSANQASNALSAYDIASGNNASWDVYNQQEEIYTDASSKYQSGMIVTASGLILSGIGFWMQQ